MYVPMDSVIALRQLSAVCVQVVNAYNVLPVDRKK